MIDKICIIYQEYFRDIFWLKTSKKVSEQKLNFRLKEYLKLRRTYNFTLSQLDEYIKRVVNRQGFHYVGGYTSEYLGPYIWKNNEKSIYNIELPTGNVELIVNMMNDFIMKSWLNFISFGDIGTGGWISGYNKEIFCIKEVYKDFLDKSVFKISLLKHEAQHICDREKYRYMCAKDLEYRAKLVELVYYPNILKFKEFFYEANSDTKLNLHCYASYIIVSKLSKKIFNNKYQTSFNKWIAKYKLIKKYSLELLEEHSIIADKNSNSKIDII